MQVAVVSGGKDYRCHGTAPGIYTRLDDPEVLNWILRVAFQRSFGHKILVATGYPLDIGQKTAIIDVISGEYCRLPDFPISLTGGIGGILGGVPMICGGLSKQGMVKDCFTLAGRGWHKVQQLETGRSYMGGGNVVINGSLLVSGGYKDSRLNSTLLINDYSGTESIADLPIGISGHCNVMLNSTHYMVIGGSDDLVTSKLETIIFDILDEKWIDGPSMIEKRWNHGCSQVMLAGKPIIWATGGFDENRQALRSTEYLDLEELNPAWKSGPDLPFSQVYHRMVTSEDSKSVYITGNKGSQNTGEILELVCSGTTADTCSFKAVPSNVKIERHSHVALTLSNDQASWLCDSFA